jgi:hypothetical protein
MSMLLNASKRFRRVQLTNYQAFLFTLPLIVVEIVILVIFSLIDPPRQTEMLGIGDGIGVQSVSCGTKSNAYFYTQLAFDGTCTK